LSLPRHRHSRRRPAGAPARPPRTAALLCGLCCALAAGAPARAQQEVKKPSDFEVLQERLHAMPAPPAAERARLLRDYLRLHADDGQRDWLVARLWLGRELLRQLDGAAAAAELVSVAERARDREPELRAAALYGLQQAQRLQGDRAAANATLQLIVHEFDGREAAESARVLLQQNARHRDPVVGETMPELSANKDARGRAIAPAEGPRLLVFWSAEHAPSERRLLQLAREWHKAGMPMQNLVAYALDDDDRRLLRFAEQHDCAFPIVAGQRGFLHPDWLTLGVTAVPSVFLVAGDGRLAARDVSPDRLAELLHSGR
jgi:hypothetical protein